MTSKSEQYRALVDAAVKDDSEDSMYGFEFDTKSHGHWASDICYECEAYGSSIDTWCHAVVESVVEKNAERAHSSLTHAAGHLAALAAAAVTVGEAANNSHCFDDEGLFHETARGAAEEVLHLLADASRKVSEAAIAVENLEGKRKANETAAMAMADEIGVAER